jgi:hypothetical protein
VRIGLSSYRELNRWAVNAAPERTDFDRCPADRARNELANLDSFSSFRACRLVGVANKT